MARIILAEDDETMVQLLSTLLRMDGFEVASITADEDVAATIERASPDMLVMDMVLWNQNGIEVLDKIRRSIVGAGLYVIMISGLNVREECMQHGADDFLLKPFMPEDSNKQVATASVQRAMSGVSLREFSYPADYAEAIRLWKSMGPESEWGIDSEAEIEKKLARDPDLFLVAADEHGLVGTVIGGFDGRRGFVYHLAVAPVSRRKGVGSLLMREVEKRLRGKGCLRCYLLVRPDNLDAQRYYKNVGWNVLDDVVFGKDLT